MSSLMAVMLALPCSISIHARGPPQNGLLMSVAVRCVEAACGLE